MSEARRIVESYHEQVVAPAVRVLNRWITALCVAVGALSALLFWSVVA